MTPEEFRALSSRIAQNLSNPELVTELLTQAGEAYSNTHSAQTALGEQVTGFEAQVKDLREKNMNLFLKIGNPVTSEKLNTTEPLQYEDLIKSMGG